MIIHKLSIKAGLHRNYTHLSLICLTIIVFQSFFKNNLNGYSSYLDGNLPFDINDFKSEEASSKTSSK